MTVQSDEKIEGKKTSFSKLLAPIDFRNSGGKLLAPRARFKSIIFALQIKMYDRIDAEF